MKKVKLFLFTLFTAIILSLNLTLTANADVPGYEDTYFKVFNQNDNLSNNKQFFEEKDGLVYKMENCLAYHAIDYMIYSSENITNKDLGLSDKYKLKKIKAKGCDIFRVEVKDETEMNTLFEQAKTLCNNKKIQNVYTLHVNYLTPALKLPNGDYMESPLEGEWWWGFLRYYYIYNEQMVDDSIILGDSDGDFDLDVRDCSFIAKNLASRETDKINEKADFNSDNAIDVRDAATLAKHLAEK